MQTGDIRQREKWNEYDREQHHRKQKENMKNAECLQIDYAVYQAADVKFRG